MLISFLFLHENICCGYSLEAPCRGASNEYPQYMFLWRNKKDIMLIPPLICSYGRLHIYACKVVCSIYYNIICHAVFLASSLYIIQITEDTLISVRLLVNFGQPVPNIHMHLKAHFFYLFTYSIALSVTVDGKC